MNSLRSKKYRTGRELFWHGWFRKNRRHRRRHRGLDTFLSKWSEKPYIKYLDLRGGGKKFTECHGTSVWPQEW